MIALALILLLQDPPLPFEAKARIERWTRTGDRIEPSSARLRVRPGRALEWVEGRSRRVILGGGADFHPAELWLHEWAELRRRFVVTVEESPGDGPAVTAPDGTPREPVRVKLRGAVVAAGPREEPRLVFRLVPRDEALRRRVSLIRAFAHPETLRIGRAAFHSPMQVTVIALDGFREAGSAEDPDFDFEGPGARKEDR